ncbi:hypothetical protein MZD04_gp311 [Pseudomonas phage Psa21]|uniref:Uncharacterized protein n=1 Tax=Pseudomonas phage Psa21 TaxID=2530023 RepID=A0A481W6K0_9CAUD|nr:hypothetical protein MZD04_gp311 [Pseudomonas phage Psa21]QBJ02837.1 hypothetical protein PSA21_311 [Pseudomonas phage Psa21]
MKKKDWIAELGKNVIIGACFVWWFIIRWFEPRENYKTFALYLTARPNMGYATRKLLEQFKATLKPDDVVRVIQSPGWYPDSTTWTFSYKDVTWKITE